MLADDSPRAAKGTFTDVTATLVTAHIDSQFYTIVKEDILNSFALFAVDFFQKAGNHCYCSHIYFIC